MKLQIMVLGMGLAATVGAIGKEDYHTFTSRSGKTIEARITDYDDYSKRVTLETPEGRPVRIKSTGLTRKDQVHIREWQLRKTIASPHRLRITVEKETLGKQRIEGVGTKTEKKQVAYELTVKNMSKVPMEGLRLEYAIFYNQEKRISGGERTKDLQKYGQVDLSALAAHSQEVVMTESIDLERYRLKGGWEWATGGSGTQDSGIRGIWIRVFVGDDTEPSREISFPDDVIEKEKWRPPVGKTEPHAGH